MITAILVIALFLAFWLLHYALLFADCRGYSLVELGMEPDYYRTRGDMGFAAFFGFISAFGGPLGTFLILCITGFAKHGLLFWEHVDRPTKKHSSMLPEHTR